MEKHSGYTMYKKWMTIEKGFDQRFFSV